INTPTRGHDPSRAGFALRRLALERRVPCVTSLDTAQAIARVLADRRAGPPTVQPLTGPAPS
ncbi:MAG: hypothetical protein ACRDFT_07480, partial [bacterium]